MPRKPNKDGYYRASVSLPNGKRIYLRAKTEGELSLEIMRTKVAIERGEITVNGNTKFERWADQWLETYKKQSVVEKSYKLYKANINNHINPFIGRKSLVEIKPVHLQEILNNLAGQSKSHVSKIRMTLMQIFESALDNDMIVKNPARKLDMPDTTSGSHRSITDDERHFILDLTKTHRAGHWILIMLYCGLRPSEAIALLWNDINLRDNIIAVSRSLGNTSTKTDAGIRNIPIPDAITETLENAKRISQSTHVFTQVKSLKPHTDTSMRCMWESFKRELDISMGASVFRNQIISSIVAKDLTPYCLRHTYATDLQRAGVPVNVAKYLLGHTDISVTANIYTHMTDDIRKSALISINQLHDNKTQKVRNG